MCDVGKYFKIYKDIKVLEPEDTLQIIMESDDKDEIEFYEMVGNFLLQQRQRKVVEENLF